MKRKMYMAAVIFSTFMLVISSAWAVDYSTMSTEELSKLRGSMQTATPAERDAFHAEWSSRVDQMTPAERQEHMGPGEGMRRTDGSGEMGTGRGKGPGDGSGGGGMGSGNGPGDGSGSGGMGSGNGSGGGGMGSGGGHGGGGMGGRN